MIIREKFDKFEKCCAKNPRKFRESFAKIKKIISRKSN